MVASENGLMCRALGIRTPCALAHHAKLFHTIVADIQAQTETGMDDCASRCSANMNNFAMSVGKDKIMLIKSLFVLAEIACMTATSWYEGKCRYCNALPCG